LFQLFFNYLSISYFFFFASFFVYKFPFKSPSSNLSILFLLLLQISQFCFFFSFSSLNFLLSSMYSLLPIFLSLHFLYILLYSLYFSLLLELLSHQSLCRSSNVLVFFFLLFIAPYTIFLIFCHFSSIVTPFLLRQLRFLFFLDILL